MTTRTRPATRTRLAGLALAAAAAGPAACNDDAFLTEQPYDFIGPTNFYQNQTDAVAAVNGVYAGLQHTSGDNYYGRNFVMLSEFLTEMQTPYLSATNERSLVDNYTFTPGHAYIYSTWTSAYAVINRANAVVARVPAIAMDTTLRRRLVGEAKFLRALNYFNLVRLFGGVPLTTTETQSLDSLNAPRATADEVYALVVADLRDAAAALPASYAGADVGRATRGAAKSLLAKAHLQRAAAGGGGAADYQAALALLRDVRATEGYALDANFGSLFDGTNENSREIVFSIQNSRTAGVGGRLSNQVAPRNSNYGTQPNGSFTAEQPFFDEFVAADRRREATWQLSFTNRNNATVNWTATQSASGTYGADTPYMRKFLDVASPSGGNDEPNYVILRYADNLLMESEAVNELSGPTAEAYAGINAVRRRANIGDLRAGLSKEAFRDSVFAQRRLELAMEGPHGYFDSQRNWPWAKARVEDSMERGRLNNFRNSKYPKAAVALTDKFRLMPIPQRAIDLNPALEQNPGY